MTEQALDPHRPIYFFVHLPKTGGQTVRRHFAAEINDHILSANGSDGDVGKKFASLPREKLDNCTLVVGHRVSHDFARHFPGRPPRFFTVLREPAALTISRYNWGCHLTGKSPPFDRWFRSSKGSLMCRWLITTFMGRDPKECSDFSQDRLFTEAAAILDRFWLVGQLENLEQSLAPAFDALGVPHVITKRKNVAGRDYPALLERTPELDAMIRERSPADVRLYERFCGRKTAAVA